MAATFLSRQRFCRVVTWACSDALKRSAARVAQLFSCTNHNDICVPTLSLIHAKSSEPVTLRAFINEKQKAPSAIRFCFFSAHIPDSFRRPSNMKKMVLKVSIEDEKSKRRAMKAVAAVEGVESVAVDIEKREISVIGEADPVVLAKKLMKLGFTELLSVGPAKEEKAAAETPTVVYHPQVNPHYAYGAYEVNPYYAYRPYEGYSSYTVVRGEDPNGCTIC